MRGRRDARARQEFRIMLHQRLRLETEMLRVARHHFERLEARRQTGKVSRFDGLDMKGMDA